MARIQDVADEAGVSPAVVSAVFRKTKSSVRYSTRTAEAVRKASEKLHYTPNLAISYLRSRQTYSVGVLVFDLCDNYCATILAGMETILAQTQYSLLLSDTRRREEKVGEYIRLFRRKRVDGIIVVGCSDSTVQEVHQQAQRNQIPTIIVGTDASEGGVPSVFCDQAVGAFEAVCYLLDLGHRRIAGIFDAATVRDSNERLAGMEKAIRKRGLELDPALICHCKQYSDPFEGGYDSMKNLLQSNSDFTAVFASGDSFAAGTIWALRQAGRRVPDDVSVVGFDDLDFARFYNPPLTTVAQPTKQMGRQAAEMFLSIASGEIPQPEKPAACVALDTKLIIRSSTTTKTTTGNRQQATGNDKRQGTGINHKGCKEHEERRVRRDVTDSF